MINVSITCPVGGGRIVLTPLIMSLSMNKTIMMNVYCSRDVAADKYQALVGCSNKQNAARDLFYCITCTRPEEICIK